MKSWIARVEHAETAGDVLDITRKFVTRLPKTQAQALPRSCLPPERLDSVGQLRRYASKLVSFHTRKANTAAVYWVAAYFATAAVRLAEIVKDSSLL